MKKVLAFFAALLLFSLAACGSPANDGATTAPVIADEFTQPKTTDAIEPETNETTTQPEEETTEDDPIPQTNQEAIDLYAAAVERTHQLNPTINKRVVKVINRPLQGDSGILKLLRISVAGFGVEKVICEDLMGEGEATYVEPAKEGLQPCWLKESDVTGFTATPRANGDIELTLRIKDCTNPLKPWLNQGSSPIGNVTWDFTNLQDVSDGIKEAEKTVPGLRIRIGKVTTSFYNSQVRAVIRPDLTFASLMHTADQKVRVEDVNVKLVGIRLGGGAWGEGTGRGTITYTF